MSLLIHYEWGDSMAYADLNLLLGLGFVIVVAIGGIGVLLRQGSAPISRGASLIPGYPVGRYPAYARIADHRLAELAAVQTRLIAIYQQLPLQSASAIWLGTFLQELREIMDTAYRVTVATEDYGPSPLLDWLILEVEQIEQELSSKIAERLFLREGDGAGEPLTGRLATLRMCVREMSSFAGGATGAISL